MGSGAWAGATDGAAQAMADPADTPTATAIANRKPLAALFITNGSA